jgi:D-arabinose 1-dehydrogenase-like Zn-dependent alcohol dehydrogenase
MKAAVVYEPNRMEIVDLPRPEPGPYDVLCKLKYGATCSATDRHIMEGTIPFSVPYPGILGHESVGEVIETGAKVRNLKQGDLITRVGAIPVGKIGIAWGGYAQYGIARDHWAMEEDSVEYPSLNPSNYRVNQVVHHSISARIAPMFTTWRETLSSINRMGVEPGMKVLIIGSGGNGLSFAAHAVNAGAEAVMLGSSLREKQARSVGVSCFINYRDKKGGESLKDYNPAGYDMIIDAVGKQNSLATVLPLITKGGRAGIYGIDDMNSLAFNPQIAGKTFTFCSMNYDESETHQQVTELVLQGKLRAENWYDLNNPIPLEDLGKAFELLKERKAVKYLIDLA